MPLALPWWALTRRLSLRGGQPMRAQRRSHSAQCREIATAMMSSAYWGASGACVFTRPHAGVRVPHLGDRPLLARTPATPGSHLPGVPALAGPAGWTGSLRACCDQFGLGEKVDDTAMEEGKTYKQADEGVASFARPKQPDATPPGNIEQVRPAVPTLRFRTATTKGLVGQQSGQPQRRARSAGKPVARAVQSTKWVRDKFPVRPFPS